MDTELYLAITLGVLFGFALNRAGATNPQNVINMVRLTDTGLMKTLVLAIGLSGMVLFAGLAFGLIDPSHISIKASYSGVIFGGALLGAGFAIAGYCPGTGLAALATGRKDALFFVIGGLVGAFAYMLVYGWLAEHTTFFDAIAGGKVTLAATGNDKFEHLVKGVNGTVTGLGLSALMIAIAFLVPKKIR